MDRFSLLAVIAAARSAADKPELPDGPSDQPAASAPWSAPASTAPRPSRRTIATLLVEQQAAGRRLHRAAGDARRPRRPGQHGARPARPGVRRHLGLRLVQPRHLVGRRPVPARPRRRDARRRHRCAAGLRRAQGLGGAAGACARHLPAVFGRPRRSGASAKAPAWPCSRPYEHALARGATILAELAGCGMSADATDIVAPTVEGPAAAMRACLADAGLAPEDVDYINAHGTGTKANDQIETAAIRRVFGAHADKLSVSSTKSMHAHCMGASGALELIACVMAIRDGIVPPTANYREAGPGMRPRRDPQCRARAPGPSGDQQCLCFWRHQRHRGRSRRSDRARLSRDGETFPRQH